VLFLGSLVVLGRLAKRVTDARRSARAHARGVATPGALYDHADHDTAAADYEEIEVVASTPWTPQPLPRPLHLSRGTAAAATMASISAAAELRRAAGRAELEERAAALASQRGPRIAKLVPAKPAAESGRTGVLGGYLGTELAPVPVAAAPQADSTPKAATGGRPEVAPAQASVAPESRYARMGIVGEGEAPALNLDEALRRRRAV
jgi:hypothetical protein